MSNKRAGPRSACVSWSRRSMVATTGSGGADGTLASPSRTPLRCRSQRVLGPGMFRIAGTQVLSHLRVRVLPKACQVRSDLLRPIIRSKEVQEKRNPSARDSWCFLPAEELLNARGEDGRASKFIFDDDPAAAGNFDAFGRFAVHDLALSVR